MINVAWFTSLREVTLMILQVTLWSGQRTFFKALNNVLTLWKISIRSIVQNIKMEKQLPSKEYRKYGVELNPLLE